MIKAHARRLKRSRYALWKNAENLTNKQAGKRAWIQCVNKPLFRAHLLKEYLRLVFQLPFADAVLILDEWMQWA
ncbi:transposase [Candidatus Aeolococcus gillhamiae]|uniref:transposase n=1 Tax=Candidatus Aeolococcus gillhamiae TaxID=3127015 RepID=UPI00307760A2